MASIAVDIILRPDEDMTDRAISWNRELNQEGDAIRLGNDDMIPHLSLAMAVVSEDNIDKIKQSISQIWQDYQEYQGKTTGIKHRKRRKKTVVALAFEEEEKLMQLHRKAADLLRKYAQDKAGTDAMYRPGDSASGSLNYVLDFLDKYSGEDFWPHITLGHGKLNREFKGETVRFPTMEIYQLGDHCTCRKKL